MNFTASDVETSIQDSIGWSETAYLERDEPFALLLDGKPVIVRTVAKSRLGEGATDVWVVVDIEGRHFRKSGYHLSHDGTYWDGTIEEVKPRQAVVTVYDTI
jgi:hypothetical protein